MYVDVFTKEFDKVFNNLILTLPKSNGHTSSKYDTHEDEDSYYITMDMPGISPQDLTILVENDRLKVTGEVSREDEKKRYYSQTWNLNNSVDFDKITAHLDLGVLTLILPKAEKIKPRVISLVERPPTKNLTQ